MLRLENIPTRIELYHPELGYIDIHPLIINKDGMPDRLIHKVAGMSLKQNGFPLRCLKAGLFHVFLLKLKNYFIVDTNFEKLIKWI